MVRRLGRRTTTTLAQGQPLKRHKSGDEVTETITAVMNDPVVVQLIEFQIVNCVRLCAAGPSLATITQH